MTDTMRRWSLKALGRENLALERVAIPEPGLGEVLVNVAAVSLNYRDKLAIDKAFSRSHAYPFVPLSDMAGTVVANGPGARRFSAGDRVLTVFMPDWPDGPIPGPDQAKCIGGDYDGMLADYVVLPERFLLKTPDHLSHAEASTLPIAALTAWYALVELGGIRAGQTVVVQGTGGVALFGLKIAKLHGATVIVTSSSDDKLQAAKKLGADGLINYRSENWADAVLRLTAGRGADHILEIAGGANLARSLEAATEGGRVWLIGLLDGLDLAGDFGHLARRRLRVEGIRVGSRRSYEDMMRAVDTAKLVPVIDSRFAFEKFPDALNRLDQGPFGKIVVDVPG
jgi:NADPH:quinone reductase and related Zn-dependent oxidoreductases